MLDRMRPTEGRDKVAIVGFCETSRRLAPYGDQSYLVAGLNRGYIFMPRAEVWFDLHSPQIRGWHHRRSTQHLEWLKRFPGPIYLHEADPELPNSIAFPLDEVQEDIGANLWRLAVEDQKTLTEATGKPYFDSSIAYEIALAIHEQFKEILLVGVDLNTAGEYVWQRSGVSYLLGLAQGRGIKVVLPDNCPLLQGNCYGRAYLTPGGERMSQQQLETRLEALMEELRHKTEAYAEWRGAQREAEHLSAQMAPGLDQERLADRVKKLRQQVQQTGLEVKAVEGGVKETLYWIHQTPDGDPPSDLVVKAEKRVNGYSAAAGEQISEGDLTPMAELGEPEPALVN